MRSVLRLLLILLALLPVASRASFHLWVADEAYSNADGSVQFVEYSTTSPGQQFLSGHDLVASGTGGGSNTFHFSSDLPADSANKKFLVATQGFAALGIVTPDYVVPNGFLFKGGGTIAIPPFGDNWSHGALPSGNLSLNRDGTTSVPTPTNFAGQTGSLPVPSVIAISPSPITFSGTSINTGSSPNIVTITNNHTATVTISSITVSGDFVVLTDAPSTCLTTPLAPTQSCQVGMYFTPKAEGTRTGTLSVVSDAPGSPNTAPASGVGEKTLVTHYYRSILRREPDAGGKAFWTTEASRMQGLGANINETWFSMAQYFFFSPEYTALARDDTGFVTDLYVTFFNRAPDDQGLGFWIGQLGQGMPREVVLAAFMFSNEFIAFTQAIFGSTAARPEVDIVMDFYRGLLGRLPDDGGFANWRDGFRAAQCLGASAVYNIVESISSGFATGSEYTSKNRTSAQYVGDLYNSFLRRGGDLGGVQFWINQIDTHALTREQVRQNFIASSEFQGRVTNIVNAGCSH